MGRDPIEILLVEDNPSDAGFIRATLDGGEGQRFSLSHVTRLAEAQDYLTREEADAVLLGLELPDATGLNGLERMRELVPGTPVVVLGSASDESTAIAVLSKGPQDYLAKGLLARALLARTIRYAIERQRGSGGRSTQPPTNSRRPTRAWKR